MHPDRVQSIYAINNTIGVSTVVYCGYSALSIPLGIIAELKQRADEYGEIQVVKKKKPELPGMLGDGVRFAEHSPLFGLVAQLRGVDNTGKLVVELDQMLGSARSITVARSDVGAIISKSDGTARPLEPTTGEEGHLPTNGGSLSPGGTS